MVNVHRNFCFWILLLVVALQGRDLFAQGKEQKRDFYNKDYAKTTFEDKGPAKRTPSKKLSTIAPSSNLNTFDSKSELSETSEAEEAETEVTSEQLSAEEVQAEIDFAEGKPVTLVGLLINGEDAEHAMHNLKELSDMATKYDWSIGPIMTVGRFELPEARDFLARLMARGGFISHFETMPERYKTVKFSPSWIIVTEEGEILLEAPGSLKKFFNKKGQLVLPDNM